MMAASTDHIVCEETLVAAALGRREQNKLEKRGRIIAAARALFTHKGFEATTSQEIAAAAAVGAGTVFTYARTKEDLLILVFHDEILEVVERAYEAARRHEGLLDRTITFFETLVGYHERDRPLARSLMRQLAYVDSADQRSLVSELMTSLLGRLAQIVQAAKNAREIEAASPLVPAARAMFAIYYYHLGSLLSGYIDRTQFDRALRTDLGLLMRGLG
jgi:AcrR family transcriptional regulator